MSTRWGKQAPAELPVETEAVGLHLPEGVLVSAVLLVSQGRQVRQDREEPARVDQAGRLAKQEPVGPPAGVLLEQAWRVWVVRGAHNLEVPVAVAQQVPVLLVREGLRVPVDQARADRPAVRERSGVLGREVLEGAGDRQV